MSTVLSALFGLGRPFPLLALRSWRCSHYDHGVHFFFQAEDGIRDVAVTGVQTCALPISLKARYTLHERLGSGGQGEVLRAHDSQRGLDIALKILYSCSSAAHAVALRPGEIGRASCRERG